MLAEEEENLPKQLTQAKALQAELKVSAVLAEASKLVEYSCLL